MEIGDWVQAQEQIIEEDFCGLPRWTHAERGAVGHVLEVVDALVVNVYWERSQTVTLVFVNQLYRLGAADTGKAPGL